MKKYIFDKRNGIHIIDLSKSLTMLEEAQKAIYDVVVSGKSILFVGTKKQAQQAIKEAAESCNSPYITTRWLGGILTNNMTIRKSVKRMRELEMLDKTNFTGFSKKDASIMRHELEKLHRNLSGIANMVALPGLMFVIDINREAIAVKEAKNLGIPVVAIVDTCCDPDPIDHIIPGNDDSTRVIRLISSVLAETVKKANADYSVVAVELEKQRQAKAEARKAAGEKPEETNASNTDRPSRPRSGPRQPRQGDGRRPAGGGRKPSSGKPEAAKKDAVAAPKAKAKQEEAVQATAAAEKTE